MVKYSIKNITVSNGYAEDTMAAAYQLTKWFISELPCVNCWYFVTSRGHCAKKPKQNKLYDLCSVVSESHPAAQRTMSFIHHAPMDTGALQKHSLQWKWPGSESSVAWGLCTVNRSYIKIILHGSISVIYNNSYNNSNYSIYNVFWTSWASLELLLVCLHSNIWPAHKCFGDFFHSWKL